MITLDYFNSNFHCCELLTPEKVHSILKMIEFGKKTGFDIYQEKTNSRNIAIECGDVTFYVSGPASKGNKKISKKCLTTKLMPLITCPNCRTCWSSCYVKSGLFRYKYYFCYMLIYTYLAQVNPALYCELLANQIINTKAKFVRLHESGDFFSVFYCEEMEKLMLRFPKVKFYTYTKTNFKFKADNLNIVKSLVLWHNEILNNFGPKEIIDIIAAELNIPVCPCGVKPVKCIDNCKLCLTHEIVLFYEHSVKPVKWNKDQKATLKRVISEYMPFWTNEKIETNPECAARILHFYAKNDLANDSNNELARKAASDLEKLLTA